MSRPSGLLKDCVLSFSRFGYPVDKDYTCLGSLKGDVREQEILLLESMHIELTYKCNFQCVFCCNKLLPSIEMNSQVLMYAIELAKKIDMHTILLTEGKQRLSPLFEKYYPIIHREFWVAINTNLNHLTPSILSLFKKYPFTLVNVSVYGMSAEKLQSKVRVQADFRVVLENLEILKAEGIHVFAKYIAFDKNYSEVEQFADFCRKNAISCKVYTNALPYGYSSEVSSHNHSYSCEIYKVDIVISPHGFLRNCTLLPSTRFHIKEVLEDVQGTYEYLKKAFIENFFQRCPYRHS